MGRAPSFGMGKLESMELPDAVAAVVRHSYTRLLRCIVGASLILGSTFALVCFAPAASVRHWLHTYVQNESIQASGGGKACCPCMLRQVMLHEMGLEG